VVTRLGRIHIHAFASQAYLNTYGVPKSLSDLRNHRVIKQSRRQQDDSAYARVLGLETLEGIVGIATNSSVVVLYAVEQGAGIGFLPTSTLAVGAPLVPVDLGTSYHLDLWLAYHREFRNSDRHKLVIAWLKSIFDPKVYACFRDEFIHPNDLVPLMVGSRERFGLKGYAPPQPFSLEAS
jgi:DNA-binding transcriptional LysR family regulator